MTSSPQPSRLTPILWDALNADARIQWLIKGVLTARGMSIWFGEPGAGKTYLGVKTALHLALGWSWFGRKVRRVGVVYIAAEGGVSAQQRIAAFKQEHAAMLGDVPFGLIGASIDLRTDDGDTRALIGEIDALRLTEPVGLIVVDTVSRAMAGGNENAPDDMGALVRNLDLIREATGAHVMGIHHCGKDAAKGARGHSLLRGAVDTEIEVTSDAKGLRTAKIMKQRDGETGATFAFRLKRVVLDHDEDGDEITSCIVVPSDEARSQKDCSLNARHRLAFEKLADLIAREGSTAPTSAHIPSRARVVTLEAWRDHLRACEVFDADMKDSARREAFRRIKDRLLETSHIAAWQGLVWIPQSSRRAERHDVTAP